MNRNPRYVIVGAGALSIVIGLLGLIAFQSRGDDAAGTAALESRINALQQQMEALSQEMEKSDGASTASSVPSRTDSLGRNERASQVEIFEGELRNLRNEVDMQRRSDQAELDLQRWNDQNAAESREMSRQWDLDLQRRSDPLQFDPYGSTNDPFDPFGVTNDPFGRR
jgi:hypothetical protein